MDRRYDFYKDMYLYELQRKQYLSVNSSIPIGFLTLIYTAYGYFAVNIHTLTHLWAYISFTVFALISLTLTVKSSILLYKNFSGFSLLIKRIKPL